MHGRYKVPERCAIGYACSGPSLPGTNMHILFPFKSVCASFVDLRPFGVISYSVTSSRTMLTKSSNPSRVPVNSWSFFITTHMREPMHLSINSVNQHRINHRAEELDRPFYLEARFVKPFGFRVRKPRVSVGPASIISSILGGTKTTLLVACPFCYCRIPNTT